MGAVRACQRRPLPIDTAQRARCSETRRRGSEIEVGGREREAGRGDVEPSSCQREPQWSSWKQDGFLIKIIKNKLTQTFQGLGVK